MSPQASYTYCIVFVAPDASEECGRDGPGSTRVGGLDPNLVTFPVMIGFLLQIVLVWTALYLMKFSLPKVARPALPAVPVPWH